MAFKFKIEYVMKFNVCKINVPQRNSFLPILERKKKHKQRMTH